ncbi:Fic family protein [Nocardia macrotermitis]|uniref:hypothetical protein n=1 Tax=Nocardia macrotermitis TaxID=2585198 RepID=UPI001D0F5449|nr:hypothetical protein [Nocardia macrotermitis]
MSEKKWAPGADRYAPTSGPPPARTSASRQDRHRFEDTGITWAAFDVDAIPTSPIERTRHRFRAHLPEFIWNTAALEGNTFTLPEVRTLLDGVTVGGKKIEEEQQIIALSEAYNLLDEIVAAGEFQLTKPISDRLHAVTARYEAIESGRFRGEGSVRGGGTVRLANGGLVPGIDPGPTGAVLREHFDNLVDHLGNEEDSRRRALLYFAAATRRQFYLDGNKRTARLMMTGELMSSGYDVVSIPFSRKLEFNNALDTLFEFDEATDLLRFLASCTLPE